MLKAELQRVRLTCQLHLALRCRRERRSLLFELLTQRDDGGAGAGALQLARFGLVGTLALSDLVLSHVHVQAGLRRTLLRKALKKQQRSKKKSSRDWASRLKTVAKSMQERQEKRKTNLAERKTKNKSKAAKHKAARAGFEGKKNSFL